MTMQNNNALYRVILLGCITSYALAGWTDWFTLRSADSPSGAADLELGETPAGESLDSPSADAAAAAGESHGVPEPDDTAPSQASKVPPSPVNTPLRQNTSEAVVLDVAPSESDGELSSISETPEGQLRCGVCFECKPEIDMYDKPCNHNTHPCSFNVCKICVDHGVSNPTCGDVVTVPCVYLKLCDKPNDNRRITECPQCKQDFGLKPTISRCTKATVWGTCCTLIVGLLTLCAYGMDRLAVATASHGSNNSLLQRCGDASGHFSELCTPCDQTVPAWTTDYEGRCDAAAGCSIALVTESDAADIDRIWCAACAKSNRPGCAERLGWISEEMDDP